MVSSIGGGMPSVDSMRQMQQRMFSRADGNGSGGLDAAEFRQLVEASPMAGRAPGGAGIDETFARIDADGNGELGSAEMEQAQQQLLDRMQSTMQAFGGNGSGGSQSAVQATDSTVEQLRAMIEQVMEAYGANDAWASTERLGLTA